MTYFNLYDKENVSNAVIAANTLQAISDAPSAADIAHLNTRALEHPLDVFIDFFGVDWQIAGDKAVLSISRSNVEINFISGKWSAPIENASGTGMVSLNSHIEGYSERDSYQLLKDFLDEYHPEPKPLLLPQNGRLDLAVIEAAALKHFRDIAESYLYEGEIRGNCYRAINQMISDYEEPRSLLSENSKAKLAVVRLPFELSGEEYIREPINSTPHEFNLSNAEWNSISPKKNWEKFRGVGAISFISFMNSWSALKTATVLYNWILDNHPEELDKQVPRNLNQLYGLETLQQSERDNPVVLSFSEQATDAARFILPNRVHVAIPNGADVDSIDLRKLKGRTVFIWPDHGEAGKKAASIVAKRLLDIDRSAEIIKFKALMYLASGEPRTETLPEGYDACSAFMDGWTSGSFAEVYGKLLQVINYKFEVKQVGSFVVKEDGVYSVKFKDGEEYEEMISSCIEVVALTRDTHNKNWGYLLRFTDRDSVAHEIALPKELLSGKEELNRLLLGRGADIYSDKLPRYLMEANPAERALCVDSTGWNGNVFVRPDKIFGEGNEHIVFQSANARKVSPFAVKGTLSEWQRNVGSKCASNSRLILATCVSLTGPFLNVLKLENGGIHIRGSSSTGKTKALTVAASIHGGKGMVRVWRATGNAIESLAREFNDSVLLLDELGQVDPREAGDIAYTLGNGQTKARSNIHGDAKEVSTWRLLFLSTGEISLADHISSGGGQIKAGQDMRMLDIPADAGAGMGVFETIHGASSPAAFADSLQTHSERYYGSVADALLNKITLPGELEKAAAIIRKYQEQFVQRYVPANSHGQITRAAQRFGAIGGAGEYCISAGILNWDAGQALWGVGKCFEAWLESRGDNIGSEDIRAMAGVRGFLERHGESRFTVMMPSGIEENNIGQRTINRAGFRRVMDDGATEFWVLPEMFKTEVCTGFDSKLVIRVLKDHGYLELDSQGKSSISKFVPGIGRMRVYVIKSNLLQSQ